MSAEIPFEAFYDLTLVTELALSPAGDRVAFVADEFDPDGDERRRALFVAPTDGSRDPHRLTRASDAGVPRWSPDGSKLGFVAAREDDLALSVGRDGTGDEGGSEGEDGDETNGEAADDEEPEPQLWVFDLERGGDARQVTDREEGVRGFDWGPAGERVVVAARDPTEDEREYLAERRDGGPIVTERLQHKFDGEGWLDSVRTYLFVVDLETRECERLDDAYGGGAFEPFLGVQPRWGTERIAFLSNRTETPDDNPVMDVYAIRPDGSDLRRLTDGDVVAAAPAWAPDGERLAFGARDPENWCIPAEVVVGNAETGAYRSLTADLDRTLTRERTVRWLDDGTLVAPFADEATTRLLRVDAESGDHEWVLDRLGEYRTVTGFDLRGGTVALALSSPGDGLDIHAMDADALDANPGDPDPLTRVSATNDALLDEHPMPDCRRVSFESAGYDLDGIVYVPPEFDPADPEPRPLVVSIHGGPVSYDAPEFRFEYAAWTSRGYVVFCPNYRGGSSYGRAFAETLHGEWGTVEVTDIVAGVEDLVERGWTAPDRVFGRGFSYGGIAQGHLVARTDLFAAAAPEHGVYDVRADFGTGDAHVWQTREFGLPWENPEAYDAASSITDVGNVDTPLLVTAGGEDWRCPPSQSEQLYVSAKKQGVPAKLVVYPDEHHAIGDPDRAIHRLEQLEDWYATHDPGWE